MEILPDLKRVQSYPLHKCFPSLLAVTIAAVEHPQIQVPATIILSTVCREEVGMLLVHRINTGDHQGDVGRKATLFCMEFRQWGFNIVKVICLSDPPPHIDIFPEHYV